jgi:DNA-binding MarR family transcriptional regulator
MHMHEIVKLRYTKEIARECIGVRTRMLNRVISSHYDDVLAPLGLKGSQLNVLVAVGNVERARPNDLIRRLKIDQTTLSRNVDRMCKERWLALEPDTDQRSHWITLTAKGKRLLEQAYPAWKAAQDKLAKRLGADGLAAFKVIVAKLLE